jgi:hypothetical protein
LNIGGGEGFKVKSFEVCFSKLILLFVVQKSSVVVSELDSQLNGRGFESQSILD